MPEIVVLEFEKITDDIAGDIVSSFELIKESLPKLFDKNSMWNEVKDAEKFLTHEAC